MILPDLPELIALRGSAQGLAIRTRQPALSHLQGSHRSTHHGRGLEFEEVRLYAQGDDVRSIDWRVTARRGRPHTKLFREEHECPTWIVADLHPGLFFGSKHQLKSVLLLRAAALLGWMVVLGGDRLGAVINQGKNNPVILPPYRREASVLALLDTLVNTQPRSPGQPDNQGLKTVLSTLQPLLQPGSLVLVLSDFSSLNEHTEAMLGSMAIHNDCRLLWITDPLEDNGLPDGTYRVGLPNRLWWMDGKNTRRSWQATWIDRQRRLEHLTSHPALTLIRLDTSKPVTETLGKTAWVR